MVSLPFGRQSVKVPSNNQLFSKNNPLKETVVQKEEPPPTPQACSIGRSERMNGGENVRMKVLQDREIVRHKIIKDID